MLRKSHTVQPIFIVSQDERFFYFLFGLGIRTYPQAWLDKTCGTHNQLIPSKRKEGVEIINNNLISLLNASEYETVKDVVDGGSLWECI